MIPTTLPPFQNIMACSSIQYCLNKILTGLHLLWSSCYVTFSLWGDLVSNTSLLKKICNLISRGYWLKFSYSKMLAVKLKRERETETCSRNLSTTPSSLNTVSVGSTGELLKVNCYSNVVTVVLKIIWENCWLRCSCEREHRMPVIIAMIKTITISAVEDVNQKQLLYVVGEM